MGLRRGCFLLTVFLCSFLLGCSSRPENPKSRIRPPPLVKTSAFPLQYQEAARAVAASLTQAGEDPREFFAEVTPENGRHVLVFHLWHESAFESQSVAAVGNPGGKCRDVTYDIESRQVTQTLLWK